MDRLSKTEIKILNFLAPSIQTVNAINGDLTKEAISAKLNIPPSERDNNFSVLLNRAYIKKVKPLSSDVLCYQITTEGKKYLEFIESDKADKIKWSIYVPIGVTLAANVGIELLKYLLSK